MDSSQPNGTAERSGHPLEGWKDYPKNQNWHDPDNPHRNLLARRMGPYELGCIPNQFHVSYSRINWAEAPEAGPTATEAPRVIENSQSLEELLLEPNLLQTGSQLIVVRGGLKPTSSTEASIEIDNDSLKKIFFRYQVSPEFISYIGSLYSHDGVFSTSSFSRQPNGELSDAEVSLCYYLYIPCTPLNTSLADGPASNYVPLTVYTRHKKDFSMEFTLYARSPAWFIQRILSTRTEIAKSVSSNVELWVLHTLAVLTVTTAYWDDCVKRMKVKGRIQSVFLRQHMSSPTADFVKSSEQQKDALEANLDMMAKIACFETTLNKLKEKAVTLENPAGQPHWKFFVEEEYAELSQRISNLKIEISLESKRLKGLQNMLFNILHTQSERNQLLNISTMRRLGEQSQQGAEEVAALARQARIDSHTMKALAFVTVFYLPGTFLATLYGTDLLKNPEPSSVRGWLYSPLAYAVIAIVLTVITFLVWIVHFHLWKRTQSPGNAPAATLGANNTPATTKTPSSDEAGVENSESMPLQNLSAPANAANVPSDLIAALREAVKEETAISELWKTDPAEAQRRQTLREANAKKLTAQMTQHYQRMHDPSLVTQIPETPVTQSSQVDAGVRRRT